MLNLPPGLVSDPVGRTCKSAHGGSEAMGCWMEARNTVTTPKCPLRCSKGTLPLPGLPYGKGAPSAKDWVPHRGSGCEMARKGCDLLFKGQEQVCQCGSRYLYPPSGLWSIRHEILGMWLGKAWLPILSQLLRGRE